MLYAGTRDELLELIETPEALCEWCGISPVKLYLDEERISETCVIARMLSDATGGEAYVNTETFAIPGGFVGDFYNPPWMRAFIEMVDYLSCDDVEYITAERCRALAKKAYEVGYAFGDVLP